MFFSKFDYKWLGDLFRVPTGNMSVSGNYSGRRAAAKAAKHKKYLKRGKKK